MVHAITNPNNSAVAGLPQTRNSGTVLLHNLLTITADYRLLICMSPANATPIKTNDPGSGMTLS